MNVKVTYVHQSSFMVETGQACLLFDFAGGIMPMFSEGKEIYVLVTHGHSDHYSHEIFELAEQYPNVNYLLSSDIPIDDVPELVLEKTTFLQPDMKWKDKHVSLETFASNDQGIALWCHVDGFDIYHAGDLNNWYWNGDAEDAASEKAYHAELDKLAGRCPDFAFIPVDPRLGDNYFRGLDDFMKVVGAKHIFPMHFWRDYTVFDKLYAQPETKPYRDKIVRLISEDDFFEY